MILPTSHNRSTDAEPPSFLMLPNTVFCVLTRLRGTAQHDRISALFPCYFRPAGSQKAPRARPFLSVPRSPVPNHHFRCHCSRYLLIATPAARKSHQSPTLSRCQHAAPSLATPNHKPSPHDHHLVALIPTSESENNASNTPNVTAVEDYHSVLPV